MESNRIALLLPCYNEEKHIKNVVLDWKTIFPCANICVCDNNSTDNSFEIAKSLDILVFRETVQGKGAAVKKLLNEIKSDYYIMVDVDETTPANTNFVLPVLNGEADICIGNRKDYNKQGKLFNSIGNSFFKFICKKIYKNKILDPLSGVRCFTYEFIKDCNLSDGFEIEVEMNDHAVKNNFTICNVNVPYIERPSESKSKLHPIRDGFKILKKTIQLWRN